MKKILCIAAAAVLVAALVLFITPRSDKVYPNLVNSNTPDAIPVNSEMPLVFKLYREYAKESVKVKIYEAKTALDIKDKKPVAEFSEEFNEKNNSIATVRFAWETPENTGYYVAECAPSFYDGSKWNESPDKTYILFNVVEPCKEHVFTLNNNSIYGDEGVPADCYNKGTAYNFCDLCGYEEQVETDLSHVYYNGMTVSSANCTDIGYKTYECKTCGYIKVETIQNDSKSHRIRPVEKVAATATRPGSAWFECANCNYVEPYQTEIPALYMEIDPALYYEQPVSWAYENELFEVIKGYKFNPDKNCTNAIVISLMYHANGVGVTAEDENPFVDVSAGDFFRDAAKWAHKYGIVEGDEFKPYEACSRGELVEYLWRMCDSPEVENTVEFSDVDEDASYSKAVSWAVSEEIVSGMDEGIFDPDRICTEAQVITFLYRVMNDDADKGSLLDDFEEAMKNE